MYLMNSPAGAILAALGVVGIVASLIWPLHGAAWVLLLVFAVLVLGGLALCAREWLGAQHTIDALRSELSAARAQVSGLTAVAADPREAPNADQHSAARIVELLPTHDGLIEQLRLDPGAGRFVTADLQPARTFVAEFTKESFADRNTHFAFMELFRTTRSFIEWADSQTRVSDGIAELVPGDERDDGWRSYSQAREEGEQAAFALTRARGDFERTALEDGVLAAPDPTSPGPDGRQQSLP